MIMLILEAVTTDVVATVIGFILVGTIGFVGGFGWKNYKNIDSLDDRVTKIENKLFGLDRDPTDDGFLQEMENKLDVIEDKIDQLHEK